MIAHDETGWALAAYPENTGAGKAVHSSRTFLGTLIGGCAQGSVSNG
jgi:hypothetical protein